MATLLVYSVSPYQPFTKILSANANADKNDIKNRINWDGSTANTGLGDDNIQSNTVSGGGLTRLTKLKAGSPNYVVINDVNGKMSEEAALAASRGGTGQNFTPTNDNDVIQVLGGVFVLAPAPSAPPNKIYNFYSFS